MIVTQLVFAFCVGISLTQEVSDKKDAIGLDGKNGAGSEKSERNKRLFFVSTTSSTSTLVTDFTCYLTKAALVTCEGRFLLYWLTTTSVITETSYTQTQTLASLHCT